MVVGSLYLELYIPGMKSLKEKRSVINRLKQKLKNKFNISVSEIAFHDLLQRGGLGISAVCISQNDVEGLLDRILQSIETFFMVQITHVKKGIH